MPALRRRACTAPNDRRTRCHAADTIDH